jgi:hypothetical protein
MVKLNGTARLVVAAPGRRVNKEKAATANLFTTLSNPSTPYLYLLPGKTDFTYRLKTHGVDGVENPDWPRNPRC